MNGEKDDVRGSRLHAFCYPDRCSKLVKLVLRLASACIIADSEPVVTFLGKSLYVCAIRIPARCIEEYSGKV